MIISTIYINKTLNRISDEGKSLTYWWDEVIVSFDPPQFSMDTDQGGFCRMNFGGIEFSPKLFIGDWPPPIKCPITIQYLDDDATDESGATTLFTGTAQITSYDRDSVKYDLYGDDYTTPLLLETVDYNGDLVPLPKIFGNISYAVPIRLADVGGKQTFHKAGIVSTTPGSSFSVFDDGINVDGNVTDNADGTFSLTATPTGEVSMSGIGEDTDLDDIVEWACHADRLNLTYSGTYVRTVQPSLIYYATNQTPLVDFLSNICAFYTHLFYISGTTLNLVDMLKNNGTRTVTEFKYFPSNFEYNRPLSTIRASWEERVAVTETIGSYVKTYNYETQKLINTITTGITDGTTSSKLVDSTADFVTDNIEIEMTAKNLTDSTQTTIVAIDDLNTLSLDDDIFISGEDYELGYIFPYGQDKNVRPYTIDKNDIETELVNLMNVLHKPTMVLKVPLDGDLPLPGEQLTIIDTSTVVSTQIIINSRNITYDLSNDEAIVIGEGVVSEYTGTLYY